LKSKQIPEFKETEIGKIPTDWTIEKLENVVETILDRRGITPKKLNSDWTETGWPVISAKNIKEGKLIRKDVIRYVDDITYEKWMSKKIKNGDIILTSEAPLGELYHVKEFKEFCIGQRLFAIRCNIKKIDDSFLFYYLSSIRGQQELSSRGTGSTVPGIRQEELRTIFICFPKDLNEQQKIGKILSDLDSKIQNIQNQNKILEQTAQTIFKSWFVDFYGVTEFEDSEKGKIPKGWSLNILDHIANNIKNIIEPKDITHDDLYIGLEHMPRDNIGLDTWENSHDLASNKFEFETNHILFGKLRPYFKKVGITSIGGICSTDILVLDSKDPAWLEFLLFTVSSNKFIEYVSQSSTGTKMPRSDWDYMKKYPIIFPSSYTLLKFHKITKNFIEMIKKNILEIKALENIRNTLLPKLISGEIRV
jgi:type I restriction enzyme, S subunit